MDNKGHCLEPFTHQFDTNTLQKTVPLHYFVPKCLQWLLFFPAQIMIVWTQEDSPVYSLISAHWLKETVYGIYSRPEKHSDNTENKFNFQHPFFK